MSERPTAPTPNFPESKVLEPLLRALVPLNRTIVSDDMDRAADLIDDAYGERAVRHRYASGAEYGSWVVPPSWNVRQAYLSDGTTILASYADHVLFLAPYSMPFEGWITREELLRHTFVLEHAVDAFSYQHRVAYDYHKRLARWEISLPKPLLDRFEAERYFVRIDVDVRPGHLNVLEYVVPGETPDVVALLAHLCHPGQANDGLSGVIAGLASLMRLRGVHHRFTYKLLVMPETIGSVIHVMAQGLSPERIRCAAFLETMGAGERLCLKLSRTGDRAIDLAARGLVRERPDLSLLHFDEGYGNDEHVFDFPNVGIPSIAVQHYPFGAYHTSRDDADAIDWRKLAHAVEVVLEVFRRLEADRIVALRYPGPPYLSRYRLYADIVTERERHRRTAQLLALCDGQHSLLEMSERTGFTFGEVRAIIETLDGAGLLMSRERKRGSSDG